MLLFTGGAKDPAFEVLSTTRGRIEQQRRRTHWSSGVQERVKGEWSIFKSDV